MYYSLDKNNNQFRGLELLASPAFLGSQNDAIRGRAGSLGGDIKYGISGNGHGMPAVYNSDAVSADGDIWSFGGTPFTFDITKPFGITIWTTLNDCPNYYFSGLTLEQDTNAYIGAYLRDNNQWRPSLWVDTNAVDMSRVDGTDLTTGILYHIVYTYDPTQTGANRIKIYINGKSQTLASPNTGNPSAALTANYVSSLDSVQWNESGSANIYDLRLYADRLLTPVDVWGMYAPETRWTLYKPTMPRMYWQLGIPVAEEGGAETLVIQDSAHSHVADNISLTQDHQLVVAESVHAHAANNVVLVSEQYIWPFSDDFTGADDSVWSISKWVTEYA
jgi:hypothetical protein